MRWLLLLMLVSANCFAQQQRDYPLPPTLDYITVNPSTGHVTLNWTPPAFNPLHPDPEAFVVYRRSTDDLGNSLLFSIDTVDKNIHSYTDIDVNASQKSFSYNVASIAGTEPSSQTTEHYTAFLTLEYDSCGNKVDLLWEHYQGWQGVDSYHIHMGEDDSWELFARVDTVEGFRDRHDIYVAENKHYYFYIEAVNEDKGYRSRSNLASISTRVARPPDYISIDSIIAEDMKRTIYYSIDASTEYTDFNLVRWSQPDSAAAHAFGKTFPINHTQSYFEDTTDAWAARSQPFYYRLHARDGCGRVRRASNLSNSLTLRAVPKRLKVDLIWDNLHTQNEDNETAFRLYRVGTRQEERVSEEIHDGSKLDHMDDLSVLRGEGYSSIFCYYVEGTEQMPNGEQVVFSRSRNVCVEVTPDVVMPNAIDPMVSERSVLEPVTSFDTDFSLIVYNRWGGLVFQGDNVGWDGKLGDGSYAKEGTYVYRLEIHLKEGRTTVTSGYVTVVYGRAPN